MNEQKTLRMVQAAPDAVVRQGYVKENGRKRLDHVIWSSALLKLEARIDIPHISPGKQARPHEESLYEEPLPDAAIVAGSETMDTNQAGRHGRRERKE